ncbi:MAG TPA: hypothetical protein VEW93_07245 [Acidimicrobiales bacterium]|nr:hypothetical protein [Acidimicrobiales bacterium]
MQTVSPPHHLLLPEAFSGDRHASRYRSVLNSHPDAFSALLNVLNDPANEQRLQDASDRDEAALRGIERQLTENSAVLAAIVDDRDGPRFRQAVGVAVRLKMQRLGWSTSGRRGPARGPHFTKAEKYVRAEDISAADRARAALDQVAAIGSEDERRQTGEQLLSALAITRASEGRPF